MGGTLKINVTHEKPESGKLEVKVVVDAKDVDATINQTYADIARRYNFQGFRRGKAPRPVIDGMIGREAILADATNTLISTVEPLFIEELDIVPLSEIEYGEDPALVEAGKDYTINAVVDVRPDAGLTSFDPVEIEMPPAEATDAEIDAQIEMLRGYHTSYEDLKTTRKVKKDDVVSIDIENVENGEPFEGKDRMLNMAGNGLPDEFDSQIVGMKPGETKEIEWTDSHEHDGEAHDIVTKVKVTLNSIKQAIVPELDDEFVKRGFGFDTVEDLRNAVRDELNNDKSFTLPNVKENRVVAAIADRLDLDELPESYVNNVYTEIVTSFLNQLERQGTTLDSYLQMAGVSVDKFLEDTREQAVDRARQSLALDAVAQHLGLKASNADVEKEFTDAGVDDVKKSIQEFLDNGRLSAVREAILRSKALEWLVEHAKVTEVDEAARAAEEAAKDKPAKKSSKKSEDKAAGEEKAEKKSTKKSAKKDDEAEEKPAKKSSKKSAKADDEAAEKPAKKSTKKAEKKDEE